MDIHSLQAVLKRALKNRKVTYRELGGRIGLSESGVKKILGGGDLSLRRAMEICEVLGVAFTEIVAEASDASPRPLPLDETQLDAFEEDPGLLFFLWALADEGHDGRRAVEGAARRLGLDLEERTRRIASLQRLGLLELRPDGSVLNRTRGFTDWRLPASLGRKVVSEIQDALLRTARCEIEAGRGAACELGMTHARLRPETAEALKEEMRALLREVGERGRNEGALHDPSELVPFGAMAVLAPFDFAVGAPVDGEGSEEGTTKAPPR